MSLLFKLHNFFEKYPIAGAGAASREQALETLKSNIEWLNENKNEIAEWFNSY